MSVVLDRGAGETPGTPPRPVPRLYPPSVTPPSEPLRLPRFILQFVRNPLLSVPEPVYHEAIVAHATARNRVAWIADPALIKDVLLDRRELFPKTPLEKRVLGPLLGNGILTSEGADWRWQRQAVAPLFRHAELLRYVPAMSRAAEAMLEEWSEVGTPAPRAIDRDMTRLTFRVITDTLMPGGEAHVGAAIERASGDYLGPISWAFAYGILRLPVWTPHPGRRRMRRAERLLRTSVGALIAERRRSPAGHDDLFTRLSAARHPETGAPISDELLLDTLLTFLMAGHETTAKTLTWTLYLLSQSRHWSERLRREIGEVAGKAPIGPEHIDRLQLTQQVVKESMRLYPPAPFLTRYAARDVMLGGRLLTAGTLINIPIFALHRHRRLWDDPDRFDPDRFAPPHEARIARTQFMPFGAGPRICVGAAFAQIEATALLATLIRGASFALAGAHVPVPVARVTLGPAGGMPMRVAVRANPSG